MSSTTRLSSDTARQRRREGLAAEVSETDISKLERQLRKINREAKAKRRSRRRSPKKSPRKSRSPKKSKSPKKSSPKGFLADIQRGTVLRKTSPKRKSPRSNLLSQITTGKQLLKRRSPKRSKSPKKSPNRIVAALLKRRAALEGTPSPTSSPLFTPPRYSPKPSPVHRKSPKRKTPSPKRSKSPKRKSPMKISSFFLDDLKKVKLRKTVSDKKEKQAAVGAQAVFEKRFNEMMKGKKKTPSPQADEEDWT